jgi:histone-lysine N-methyltransferase SETDB1
MDDIPKGEFICVYVGELLTEQQANEHGELFGDEYMAELDFVKTIQMAKDCFESYAFTSDSMLWHIHTLF